MFTYGAPGSHTGLGPAEQHSAGPVVDDEPRHRPEAVRSRRAAVAYAHQELGALERRDHLVLRHAAFPQSAYGTAQACLRLVEQRGGLVLLAARERLAGFVSGGAEQP